MSKFNPFNEQRNHKSPEVESLHKISGSSIESMYQDVNAATMAANRELLKSLIIPELQGRMDMFSREILKLKNTLDSNRQNMAEINDDIADIYLTMYQIYRRFEKHDRKTAKKSKKERVRFAEAEARKQAEERVSEIPEKDAPPDRHQGGQQSELRASHSDTQLQRGVHFASVVDLERIEKRQFLKNMLFYKKSKFTINLNRNHVYFPELVKVLTDIKQLAETSSSSSTSSATSTATATSTVTSTATSTTLSSSETDLQ